MKKVADGSLSVWILSALMVVSSGRILAQGSGFQPGKLAVLRIGDGISDLSARQNPVFVDQFDPGLDNQAKASFSAAIPTAGTNALWMNGNAGTEGGMARSANHSALTLAGYCGDMLSMRGTPSKLNYDRGICVVAADGSSRLAYKGSKWYGLSGEKTNPRGVASDGVDNFWGCGNVLGTLFYSAGTGVISLKSAASTRAVKIVNQTVYTSIMSSDGDEKHPGGIYNFADASHAPAWQPKSADAAMNLVVPVTAPYVHVTGFDMNPQGNVAYLADIVYGIQKYMKSGDTWKLACNFHIPGYAGAGTGILTNSTSTGVRAGCFGLAVDFSGPHPVVYATTTEWVGYGGLNVNSNRLIRLDDTYSAATGTTITNFARTLAFAPGTNECFRAVDFTPEPGH